MGVCVSRHKALDAVVGSFCAGSAHGALHSAVDSKGRYIGTSLQRAAVVVPP